MPLSVCCPIGDDRITVIIIDAYLEHFLGRCVRMHLHYVEDISDKDFDFGSNASFEGGEKLGRLTRIYADQVYGDLRTIIRIRNLFAHRMDIHELSHPESRS